MAQGRLLMVQEEAAEVAELIGRSNRLGSDRRNTNYAGGNASAKGTAADPAATGRTRRPPRAQLAASASSSRSATWAGSSR